VDNDHDSIIFFDIHNRTITYRYIPQFLWQIDYLYS